MPSSRSTRSTTTTTPRSSRARRWPTTWASSERAGKSTPSPTGWATRGFLKALTSQYRAHVYLSDVVRLGGRVVDKAVDGDGDRIVRFETWATNQRGDNVMPGTAVIALPERGNSESGAPGLPRALASSKVP